MREGENSSKDLLTRLWRGYLRKHIGLLAVAVTGWVVNRLISRIDAARG